MIREQAGQSVSCQMITASDGSEFTGTVTVYVLGDAGTLTLGSVGSGICTHEGGGLHSYLPSAAETNYDVAAFQFRGTGAITRTKEYPTITVSQAAALGVSGVAAGLTTFGDLYMEALDTELGSNDSAVLFTTTRRQHAINEGIRQFCDLTECLKQRSTITVSSSAQEFNLNSTTIIAGGDFVRVSDEGPAFKKYDTAGSEILVLAGDRDFPQREVPWLDAASPGWRSTNTGTPGGWYLRDDAGAFYFGLDCPVNVSTSETAELIVPYIARPSSMTDDDHAPFVLNGSARRDLNEYAQAAVHFAAHRLEKLRKDKEASDSQLQSFLGYVQRFLQAKRPKGPRSVRMGKSYFRDAIRGPVAEGERAPWWR
jgi:hypothetical protein